MPGCYQNVLLNVFTLTETICSKSRLKSAKSPLPVKMCCAFEHLTNTCMIVVTCKVMCTAVPLTVHHQLLTQMNLHQMNHQDLDP